MDVGRIGLPGGRLDQNEAAIDAVIRESAEEGLSIGGKIFAIRDGADLLALAG